MLLFRAVVGSSCAIFGALYLSRPVQHPASVWALASLCILGGAALVIGFVTPLASLSLGLCMAGVAVSWFSAPPLVVPEPRLVALFILVLAIALALVGPGAFSLDGYLFGRREIVIPPRS